jgi:hypothetical protein
MVYFDMTVIIKLTHGIGEVPSPDGSVNTLVAG